MNDETFDLVALRDEVGRLRAELADAIRGLLK